MKQQNIDTAGLPAFMVTQNPPSEHHLTPFTRHAHEVITTITPICADGIV